jgi:hypothetical protein
MPFGAGLGGDGETPECDAADGEGAPEDGAGLPGLATGEGLEGFGERLQIGGIGRTGGIERPGVGDGGTLAMDEEGVVLEFGEGGGRGEGVGHDQRASSR